MIRVLRPILLVNVPSPCSIQCVRWRGKPRWLPPAKSRMFNVNPQPELPPEERRELDRIVNNYSTSMKSLSKYFQIELDKQSDLGEINQRRLQLEAEEHTRLMEYNSQENARVAKLREERTQKEWKAEQEALLARALQMEEQWKRDQEVADQIVKKAKRMAAMSLTRETLDAAIEEALGQVVDYNWAIGADGSTMKGSCNEPLPSEAELKAHQPSAIPMPYKTHVTPTH